MAPDQEYEDKVEESVNETTTLYRPVGQEELNLIQSSGYREFPPRLPHQPIFYAVAASFTRSSISLLISSVRLSRLAKRSQTIVFDDGGLLQTMR